MGAPLIAITPWRRTLSTWVHPADDLYTLNPDYTDSVSAAGGLSAIVPHVRTIDEACAMLERFDALLVSGGRDVDPSFYEADLDGSIDTDPATDVSDLAFIHAATKLDLPMLAICRGAQIMNVASGGTLRQHMWDVSEHHPARQESTDAARDADTFLANRHAVTLTPGSIAAKVFDTQEIGVNSLHHQAVDRPGTGIVVTGTAPDGIIEVIEHENGRSIGVQWHPERMAGEGHSPLFQWLVDAARSERH